MVNYPTTADSTFSSVDKNIFTKYNYWYYFAASFDQTGSIYSYVLIADDPNDIVYNTIAGAFTLATINNGILDVFTDTTPFYGQLKNLYIYRDALSINEMIFLKNK